MPLVFLRRPLHVSWLIASLCGGIVVGAVGAQWVSSGLFASIVWLATSLILGVIAVWRGRYYAVIFAVAAGVLLGLWRGSVDRQVLAPLARLEGRTVSVRGSVDEDLDTGKNGEMVLRLDALKVDGHPLAGELWVSTARMADVKRGDVVDVEGRLSKGFGSFAASMYRAELNGIKRPYPGDVARRVRDGFADDVRRVVTEPQASLGIGYLVGQRRALPTQLEAALRIAGLMHVVVASGYNLTILVRLARRLFARVSKYLAAFASVLMIVGFVAVTGASPSMTRAGLVAGLSLAAWYYGRRFHPLVLLLLVAAITLLIHPGYGSDNLGWQLSFASFAGVMLLAPLTQRYFFGVREPGTLRQILGETIAAQLCTLPLLIIAFGQVSNVAVVANLLVLPLVPLAMLLTFTAGLATLCLPLAAASVIALPAQWLLGYMTGAAEILAQIPWAQTAVSFGWGVAAASYGALIFAGVYMWRKTRLNLRETSIVE